MKFIIPVIRSVVIFTTLAIALPWAVPSCLGQTKYSIVGLGHLEDRSLIPQAINDSGVIVGGSLIYEGAVNAAFIWKDGAYQFPGTLGGEESGASDINNQGVVAGFADIAESEPNAMTYANGTMAGLGTLGTGRESFADGLNDLGAVVGQSAIIDSLDYQTKSHAFLHSGGAFTDLGTLGGSRARAADINEAGLIVGISDIADEVTYHAFIYRNGAMTDLGALGTNSVNNSVAEAINDSGVIVGYSEVDGGGWHPFVHKDGVMTDLGFPGYAYDINNRGEVVGIDESAFTAFLYREGVATDLNSLIDPASGWTLYDAWAINDRGQIVGSGYRDGIYQPFVMTPPEFKVTRPFAGERWVVGEPDTIRWQSPISRPYELFYSGDDGATYTLIGGAVAGDSLYVWHPPDDIRSSSESRIMVKGALVADSAVSGRFTLRAVDLVRELSDGKLDPFYPSEHSWQYPNTDANTLWPESWWDQFDYANGYDYDLPGEYPNDASLGFRFRERSGFPDWPLFVTAVTRPHCYVESFWGLLGDDYNSEAVRIWGLRSTPWTGSCYGLSMTALLEFSFKSEIGAEFPEMAGLTSLPAVPITNDIRRVINLFQNYTLTPRVESWVQFADAMTPRQTLEQLRLWLLSETRDDDRALVIESQSTAGSHAVLPYIVERKQGSPGVFTIYLYDPNQPLNNSATIEIDSAANTWTDLTPLNYGSGPTGCYPTLQAWRHLRTLAPEFEPKQAGPPAPRPVAASADPTTVVAPPGMDVVLVDAAGDTVGFMGGVAIRGIDSATVFITPTGGFSPPGKYLLPAGDYRAVLDAFTDTTVSVAIERDSVFYSYRRADAGTGQRDLLAIGNGVGFVNPDTAAKRVDWKVVFSGDSVQTTFDLENVVQPGGDSLALSGAAGMVRIGGGTAGKSYDLKVKRSSPGGTTRFLATGLVLAAGAAHEIVPADDSLSSVLLRIDEDSDGIVDDSVSMENELTAVADGRGADIPAAFALHPNYPNPFNPSTTIRYALPAASRVTLKVYDVLGREIATLVDGVERAGYGSVEWDAGSHPGGVYYLRMSAGSFSATEKLVLLK